MPVADGTTGGQRASGALLRAQSALCNCANGIFRRELSGQIRPLRAERDLHRLLVEDALLDQQLAQAH